MKKIILILVFSNILINTCFTQTSVWKIEGKGTTMYIGGTIHLLRPQDYPIPAEFDSAYALSEVVVFEADLGKMEDPAIAQDLMVKAMYQDEKTLKSVLSKEVYEALEKESLKFNIPLAGMDKFKPFMVILTLTVMKMQQLGISIEGVDKHYFSQAKTDKKNFLFFETVDEQIKMITDMGAGNEEKFVLHSLKDFDDMGKELSELIATWRDGTAKNMVKQLEKMKNDFPKIYQTLLVDRNNDWLPKIEVYLDDEAVEFILVGALHLHGSDGILKKLKERGYSVEQF